MADTLIAHQPQLPEVQQQPVTAPSPRRSSRYDSLDMWRGIACIAVVIYHATMQVVPKVSYGETLIDHLGFLLIQATGILWVGVPMFFVISGYCIFATLEKSVARGDSLGAYFYRRFRRIYPPYWIAIAVCGLAITMLEIAFSPGLVTQGIFTVIHPFSLSASQWLGNLSLTESWRQHVGGGPTAFILPHVWTLCYEEQFYAVAGLILLLAPRRMFTASLLVSFAVAGTMVLRKRIGISLEGTFLDGRWLLFAAGILVFYAINHASPRTRAGISVGLATAAFLMLISGSVPWEFYLNRSVERFTAIVFALVLIVLHRKDQQIREQRWTAPLFVCGTMCYSLYLTHALITKAVGHAAYRTGMDGAWETLLITTPVCIAISVSVGWLFYLTVERRFLNR